jgi:CRP-like cAMP-binding protein
VFRANDRPAGVFGLFDGMLELAVPRMDGEEFVFHRVEPGFWIGDLALFSGQRRLVTVRAAVKSRLVYLPQNRLATLARDDPSLISAFYQLSYDNMRIALRLLGNLSISRAEKRIALRLLVHADQHEDKTAWIRLSQDALSDLLSLSSQSVRRCLRRLEAEHLIEVGYGRVRVIDRNRLAALYGYAGMET